MNFILLFSTFFLSFSRITHDLCTLVNVVCVDDGIGQNLFPTLVDALEHTARTPTVRVILLNKDITQEEENCTSILIDLETDVNNPYYLQKNPHLEKEVSITNLKLIFLNPHWKIKDITFFSDEAFLPYSPKIEEHQAFLQFHAGNFLVQNCIFMVNSSNFDVVIFNFDLIRIIFKDTSPWNDMTIRDNIVFGIGEAGEQRFNFLKTVVNESKIYSGIFPRLLIQNNNVQSKLCRNVINAEYMDSIYIVDNTFIDIIGKIFQFKYSTNVQIENNVLKMRNVEDLSITKYDNHIEFDCNLKFFNNTIVGGIQILDCINLSEDFGFEFSSNWISGNLLMYFTNGIVKKNVFNGNVLHIEIIDFDGVIENNIFNRINNDFMTLMRVENVIKDGDNIIIQNNIFYLQNYIQNQEVIDVFPFEHEEHLVIKIVNNIFYVDSINPSNVLNIINDVNGYYCDFGDCILENNYFNNDFSTNDTYFNVENNHVDRNIFFTRKYFNSFEILVPAYDLVGFKYIFSPEKDFDGWIRPRGRLNSPNDLSAGPYEVCRTFSGGNKCMCVNYEEGYNCECPTRFDTNHNCDRCLGNFETPDCTTCKNNWIDEYEDDCEECPDNFDKPSDCIECSYRFTNFPLCDTCKKQYAGKGCSQCFGNWDGFHCDECPFPWNISENCEKCINGYHISEGYCIVNHETETPESGIIELILEISVVVLVVGSVFVCVIIVVIICIFYSQRKGKKNMQMKSHGRDFYEHEIKKGGNDEELSDFDFEGL